MSLTGLKTRNTAGLPCPAAISAPNLRITHIFGCYIASNFIDLTNISFRVVNAFLKTRLIRATRKARSACIRDTKSICWASSTGRFLLKHGRISRTAVRDGIRSDFERVGKDIAKVIDFEVKRTNKSSQ